MPSSQTCAGQRTSPAQPTPRHRARTMPIAAPMANVMATIWKGGIGPARTESVASEPQRQMAASPAAIARRRTVSTVVIVAA